jgi:predicted DNA-binding transcriptional regulator YafY
MTKPARLLQLVTLLGGRRSHTVCELAAHFETTERTIFRDLADLQALGIPVTRDEYGYRLAEGATLRPLNLDAEERAVLRLALANPALRKTKAIARRLERLAAKLHGLAPMPETGRVVLADLDRSGPVQPGLIESLETAMGRSSPVEIDYASLRSGRRSRRGVDPLALFHRGEAWYLAGRCHRHDEVRLFRLDRIGAVRELPGTFAAPEGFSVEELLASAWSLHHGAPRYDVVIRFEESLAPLIANARHHEGERVERLPDGALEYRVRLADLEEIARWIVGFGGKAVVVEPEELAARVRALAEGVVDAHPARALRAVARVAASPRSGAPKKKRTRQ